jgi:hypothetical protein
MQKEEIDEHIEEVSALAMLAMNGLLSNKLAVNGLPGKYTAVDIAKSAYLVAICMLKEKKDLEEQLTILADDE